MIILQGSRIILRKMTQRDITHLMHIFSDPVAMLYYPRTRSRPEAEQWIARTQYYYRNFGHGMLMVQRRGDGQVLGQCGIVPQEVGGELEREIGYLFKRKFWGQGFATEAALLIRDWGFITLKAHRLISLINPQNSPSQRVAARIGMELIAPVFWRQMTVDLFAISEPQWKLSTKD